MSYRDAFPEFSVWQMPAIPSCWFDESWRQDACPSFRTARGLSVWVDYADPDKREHGDGARFIVCKYDPRGAETLLESDDWQAVLAFCRGYDGDAHAAAYLPAMFAAQVRADIESLHPGEGQAKFDALRAENLSPDYRGGWACASHNYCDANESMLTAFAACMGRPLEIQNADDMGAMQSAWTAARNRNLI